MTTNVTEEIPAELRAAATAAVDWVNEHRGTFFELTGLVDPGKALAVRHGEAMELGLVLCDGEVCLREQVVVRHHADGYEVATVPSDDTSIPANLDPPPGNRRAWLDRRLRNHDFVLLVFYRGFW